MRHGVAHRAAMGDETVRRFVQRNAIENVQLDPELAARHVAMRRGEFARATGFLRDGKAHVVRDDARFAVIGRASTPAAEFPARAPWPHRRTVASTGGSSCWSFSTLARRSAGAPETLLPRPRKTMSVARRCATASACLRLRSADSAIFCALRRRRSSWSAATECSATLAMPARSGRSSAIFAPAS